MRSKRDTTQIQQFEHDEAANAKRVKITDTELSIELNHADGDSVTTHPAKLIVSVTGVEVTDNGTEIIPPMDCSSLRQIKVDIDGTGDVEVWVSPTDSGPFFYSIGNASTITDICARRIKIKSVDAIGDVHFVGRS